MWDMRFVTKVAAGAVATALVCGGLFSLAVAGSDEQSGTSADKAQLHKLIEDYHRPTSIPFPEDNPYSDAKSELGKMLFFDPRLSVSNLISCATCHNPSFAWEDAQALGSGDKMGQLGRHTPTILNLAWSEVFFWDGRADSLEEQALGPIAAAAEMAQPLDELVEELGAIEGYRIAFALAFPGEGVTEENIAMAIATFERTIVSNLSAFDRWVRGDGEAISASAQRGFMVFNTKARCANCHSGWNFTDDSFHDIGLASEDLGRSSVLGGDILKHAFKTPGLRNIVERAPYMHDGSLRTLAQVVDHYDDGFVQRDSLSDEMQQLQLSDAEKTDLIAFLKTLSSNDDPMDLPVLPN
jgi:cytochrome c peroxidase